jgi:hypothetical protein
MLGMYLVLDQRLEQTLKLSQAQKMSLRLDLLDQLRELRLYPKTRCTLCDSEMTYEQLLKGFLQDPEDTTTKCPTCKRRFQPLQRRVFQGGSMECRFLCAGQTLHRLPAVQTMSPEVLRKHDSSLYYSALTHFGSLRTAFKKIDVDYALEDTQKWKDKVQPFLGKFPDSLIAECVGLPWQSVSAFRRKLGINKHTG